MNVYALQTFNRSINSRCQIIIVSTKSPGNALVNSEHKYTLSGNGHCQAWSNQPIPNRYDVYAVVDIIIVCFACHMMSANWLQPRQRCRPPSNLVCRQSSWQCETAFSLLHMHICHCPIMRSLQEASQWTCAGQKQLSRDQMSRDIKTQWSKKWEGWEEYVDQSNLVYYA